MGEVSVLMLRRGMSRSGRYHTSILYCPYCTITVAVHMPSSLFPSSPSHSRVKLTSRTRTAVVVVWLLPSWSVGRWLMVGGQSSRYGGGGGSGGGGGDGGVAGHHHRQDTTDTRQLPPPPSSRPPSPPPPTFFLSPHTPPSHPAPVPAIAPHRNVLQGPTKRQADTHHGQRLSLPLPSPLPSPSVPAAFTLNTHSPCKNRLVIPSHLALTH